MRIKLRNRYFHFAFGRLDRQHDGVCDFEKRTITVRRSLQGERQLEITLHELLHACHWDLDEQAVDETAKNLSKVLWRLGYRRQENNDG